MSTFQPFPKVPRLSRDIVVTEKLDGTNASIEIVNPQATPDYDRSKVVAECDGLVMLIGSRTRYIRPGDDNFGFAAWAAANADPLIIGLGEGRHYGEWWGSGIQRGYGLLKGEKRFSLFNAHRWAQLPPILPAQVGVVPVLYQGPFSQERIEDVLRELAFSGSVAAPGFMKPEGIIIYHTAGGHLYKKTIEGDESYKGAA
jgi:hypothetical protein